MTEHTELKEGCAAETETGDARKVRSARSPRLKAELEKAKAEIERLNAELEERVRLYQRLQADFDNFRKRTASRQEELSGLIKEEVILQILPVVDNLERALQASETSDDVAALAEGVAMTHRQFCAILSNAGVVPLEVCEQQFDPAFCEAIMFEENSSAEDGMVVQELQKGYKMGERIIRPAMVKVARSETSNK
ncbi:MAG: nucleotide exchange factor GrpE [bacterium]|jgi:molecular chaperone GrpE|nr:nucleotide exchange factor GrpE [bacterium]MDD3805202.1 nucleotide exchange factor GrpE [bacterium]MDD4557755.1 nucleotide exchange factor GrpE [bacterium]